MKMGFLGPTLIFIFTLFLSTNLFAAKKSSNELIFSDQLIISWNKIPLTLSYLQNIKSFYSMKSK